MIEQTGKNGIWAGLALCAAAAAGCATVGHEFDTTHAHDVKAGTQNKEQIKAWFGEPETVTTMTANAKGCVTSWMYRHGHSSVGSHATAEVLVVNFDEQGAVCDTAYSEIK